MSYDIRLKDQNTGEVVSLHDNHMFAGGTYMIGGTREAWLNVTWNYGKYFYKVIDKEKGIRVLYGMTAKDSIPVLERAIEALTGEPDQDYWAQTEGNARAALCNLLALAKMVPPNSVWDGD